MIESRRCASEQRPLVVAPEAFVVRAAMRLNLRHPLEHRARLDFRFEPEPSEQSRYSAHGDPSLIALLATATNVPPKPMCRRFGSEESGTAAAVNSSAARLSQSISLSASRSAEVSAQFNETLRNFKESVRVSLSLLDGFSSRREVDRVEFLADKAADLQKVLESRGIERTDMSPGMKQRATGWAVSTCREEIFTVRSGDDQCPILCQTIVQLSKDRRDLDIAQMLDDFREEDDTKAAAVDIRDCAEKPGIPPQVPVSLFDIRVGLKTGCLVPAAQ